MKKFKRVLIANRGEIAVRIARTLKEMNISPIAIYSDIDRSAFHVRSADMAYHVGPSPSSESYLAIDKIIDIAKRCKADAIHPGYGFLSENAEFVELLEANGIAMIGPSPHAIRTMGSKTKAREVMIKANVPVVLGSDGPLSDEKEALKIADKIGYPVMLKASAGGGGKGMRLVENASELEGAFRMAVSEAKNYFGDETIYLEKVIVKPRHIEIQIFSGSDGKTVWLGERECSMQRRHQKVIEETPSVCVDEKLRKEIGEVACRAAEAVDYRGAGTIEFLLDQDKKFYFLEMNTRLQVEHPVTEFCCGIDLVEAQVHVAQGGMLPWEQDDIIRKGHSIEARVYAEDPDNNFMPSPGYIAELIFPQGPGIRVDSGVCKNFEVPRFYDPMIAKIIVWAENRERARKRLYRALSETKINGIKTNIQFLRRLLRNESFIKGDYHTGSISEVFEVPTKKIEQELLDISLSAMAIERYRRDTKAIHVPKVESLSSTAWRSSLWRLRGG